uniref:Reticulocalbin-3 n=1 Tax=Lygus hesperus TaxID=30085 RepID=A0A0A9WL96_LYGHE
MMALKGPGCSMKLAILIYLFQLVFQVKASPKDLKNDLKSKDLDEKDHYKEGAHNAEYDHEAFLGEEAKSFQDLPPEESKKRLGIIVDKIDTNKDGTVSRHELQDWIRYTQQKYVRDNVDRTWKIYNPENKDDMSWETYSKAVYGFMKDLSNKELTREEDGVSYQGLYDRDLRRWHAADSNGDNNLTKDEFFAFLHPEETPRLRDLVVLETIESIDKDKDGKISLSEYTRDLFQGEDEEEQPEWLKIEIEHFNVHRDKDKDGFLDNEEVKDWLAPQDYDHADAEAKHLIYEADKNNDEQLSKDEILNSYDVFVGSQATDFGEALMRHDEF